MAGGGAVDVAGGGAVGVADVGAVEPCDTEPSGAVGVLSGALGVVAGAPCPDDGVVAGARVSEESGAVPEGSGAARVGGALPSPATTKAVTKPLGITDLVRMPTPLSAAPEKHHQSHASLLSRTTQMVRLSDRCAGSVHA
ncbi:hypothetical protein CLV30_10832 [Haloactinopolyspora alba]|uniref:Uncharacterized protein n=1 Tax=Haloactinopolyspora alba TaxID=648780 RepID=A0A2P8E0X7_9ACTN|nr:hypothetical protein CLV30_10832 [Haloactinopolyspora alba]